MCVTSLINSKKLVERGIPKRTADYVWIPENGNFVLRSLENLGLDIEFWVSTEGAIPAWSTDRLLDILPTYISDTEYDYRLVIKKLTDSTSAVRWIGKYEVSYRAITRKDTNEGGEVLEKLNQQEWVWIGAVNVDLHDGALKLLLSLTMQSPQESPVCRAVMENIEYICQDLD